MQQNGDTSERLSALKARLARVEDVKTRLRKLNVALSGIALSEKPRQLALVKSATSYIDAMTEVPIGVKPLLAMIHNELTSIREGIVTDSVHPRDLVLLSGTRAVKSVDDLRNKILSNISLLESSNGVYAALDPAEQVLLKNKQAKEKIPEFGDKDFIICRAPVAFTFQNKEKHSSVGYIDADRVQALGFKVSNLGGYTILHEQLMIGVNADAIYAEKESDSDTARKKLRVSEQTTVFHGGKPTKVSQKRDQTYMDVAMRIKKQIETKSNQPYSFVNDKSTGFNGGQWFWVIPTKDMNRMAKAFPGGHVSISKWGFAF